MHISRYDLIIWPSKGHLNYTRILILESKDDTVSFNSTPILILCGKRIKSRSTKLRKCDLLKTKEWGSLTNTSHGGHFPRRSRSHMWTIDLNLSNNLQRGMQL